VTSGSGSGYRFGGSFERERVVGFGFGFGVRRVWCRQVVGEVGEVEGGEVLTDGGPPRDRSGWWFGLTRLRWRRVPVPFGVGALDPRVAMGLLVVVDLTQQLEVRA